MTENGVPIIGSYDYRLVALSVLIAVLASYAALDLAARGNCGAWRSPIRLAFWGRCRDGTGIWSMHYIGMRPSSLPIPVLSTGLWYCYRCWLLFCVRHRTVHR